MIRSCSVLFLLQHLIRDGKLIVASHGIKVGNTDAVSLPFTKCDRENAIIPTEFLATYGEVAGKGIEVEVVVIKGPHMILSQAVNVQTTLDQIRYIGKSLTTLLRRDHINRQAGQTATRVHNAFRDFETMDEIVCVKIDYPNAGSFLLLMIVCMIRGNYYSA